jgi:carbonic anhydrase
MSVTDELLQANEEHAAEAGGVGRKAPPTRQVLVLTCMDARLDPARFLGLSVGDAHVLRNAGARVTTDVLRSLTLSQHALGTREVVVIHHTDCGLLTDDTAAYRDGIAEAAGADLGDLELLAFSDEEGSLRDDVAAVRAWPHLHPETTVRGFLFDVDSSRLREVG